MTTQQQTVLAGTPTDKSQHRSKTFLVAPNGTAALTGPNITHPPLVTATAIATVAKAVAEAEPTANTLVVIKFTNGNSAAAPTVSFAGGAARAIQLGGAAPIATEITIAAGGVALFFWDGTVLHQIGVYV